jgi:hypothetical protein
MMTVKQRIKKLEQRSTQQQEAIILTIVWSDGGRGPSYEVTTTGLREVQK